MEKTSLRSLRSLGKGQFSDLQNTSRNSHVTTAAAVFNTGKTLSTNPMNAAVAIATVITVEAMEAAE